MSGCGRRCEMCGVMSHGGVLRKKPIELEPEPVVQKPSHGQLHPYGADPRTWTPKPEPLEVKTGGRITAENEAIHLLKQLGFDLKPKKSKKK